MKRIVALLFALFLITSVFAVHCCAEGISDLTANETLTVSDDFSKLYIGNKTYSRFNVNTVVNNVGRESVIVVLSDEQRKTVESASAYFNPDKSIVELDVFYLDGADMTVYFLADECKEAYDALVDGYGLECKIDFQWPVDNVVVTEKTLLLGEKTTVTYPYFNEPVYSVMTKSNQYDLYRQHGVVWVDSEWGLCYYLDFQEYGITSEEYLWNLSDKEVTCYEIVDPELKEQLLEAQEESYSDGFGFFENSSLTKSISAVFLVFAFGVLPFVVLVLSVIFFLRTRFCYRKIFLSVAILSGIELLIFVTLLMIAIIF